MLRRSAIAIPESLSSSEAIMAHILSKGVNCLSIKSMGGMQHLIIFDTLEDKKSMLESKCLERWFIAIRNVNSNNASLWREAWINIYDHPLIAWGYDNFYNVGCVFGRVISVNYENYDRAKIMVYTDFMFDINSKITVEIDGKIYCFFLRKASGVAPSPNLDDVGDDPLKNQSNQHHQFRLLSSSNFS